MPELYKNDQALVQYFLRGMRRFVKHVGTDNPTEAWGQMFSRVEVAFHRARTLFQRELQQEAAKTQGEK